MTSILYLQSPDLLVSNKEELGFRGGDWFEIRNSYSYSISYSYSNLKVPISIVESVRACVVQRKYGRAKTDVFIHFRLSCVDFGKRCENANVDVNTFMRF